MTIYDWSVWNTNDLTLVHYLQNDLSNQLCLVQRDLWLEDVLL